MNPTILLWQSASGIYHVLLRGLVRRFPSCGQAMAYARVGAARTGGDVVCLPSAEAV